MKSSLRLLIGLAVTSCLVALPLTAAHASADATPDATAQVISEASALLTTAQQTTGSLPEPDGSLTAFTSSGETTISSNPSDGISLESDKLGATINIGLPNLRGASDSTVAANGTVVYSTDESTSLAVQPTATGVRLLSVLQDSSAPSSFDYDLDIPDGATLALATDGGATITDAAGLEIAAVKTPWATDSNGLAVPTHYEIDAGKITQFVGHKSGNFAYPIVADPDFWWWVSTAALCAVEIAPFITPFLAAKFIAAFAKAGAIVKKSEKLTAAVEKLGGLKSALNTITKFAINKGAGMSPAVVALIKVAWMIGLQVLFSVLGIGDCGALLLQIRF